MITRIREVRRARGMTLDEVARACEPPTTPQTIGRLETGTRTVSVGWLNRIAKALDVDAADLVESDGEKTDVPVAAIIGASGASAPRRTSIVVPPRPKESDIAVTISESIGDYRAGDEVWCETLQPEEFGRALNRDILIPRPVGRFLFGRLIGREEPHAGEASGKLHLLPLGAGMRQQVVTNAPWIAMATKLVRSL
ncbi:MAG TPA: helix-turn-helix transcriptional regulator [Sphingomicrobium sp.]|nr:helix-turn-helix transcriptional regulator [Sphingomicrobium sp.]